MAARVHIPAFSELPRSLGAFPVAGTLQMDVCNCVHYGKAMDPNTDSNVAAMRVRSAIVTLQSLHSTRVWITFPQMSPAD